MQPGTITYNLKGFAIGNGITDWTVDAEPVTWETFAAFNLIPYSLFQQFGMHDCRYDVAKPYNNSDICRQLENQANDLISGLNPYDLFRTTYGMSGGQSAMRRRLQDTQTDKESLYGEAIVGGEVKRYKRGVRLEQYTPWVKKNKLLSAAAAELKIPGGDPMTDYLNRADVRSALHIPISVQAW